MNRKMLVILACIICMMIPINWDKEVFKGFVTGGVAGAWILVLVKKHYTKS